MSPTEFRLLARRGEWTRHAIDVCDGYAKFNLVVLPKEQALIFLQFAERNPQACAIAEFTEPGSPYSKYLAPGADIRTDLPGYRVFRDGVEVAEEKDVRTYWRDDLVAFLIGAVFNTYVCLHQANISFRFAGAYTTNLQCTPVGCFYGSMPVSCAIFRSSYDAVRAVQIASRMPAGHGPPVHIGDPAAIGIKDLSTPDIFSLDQVPPCQAGEIPMFWGEGITPQAIAIEAKVPFMITHKPAHFFIADKRAEELAIL